MTQKLRSRGWSFTAFEKLDFNIGDYCIVGEEICPKTGRLHYQGYVYFTNARVFNTVKKLLGNSHIEPAHHSPNDNIRYCSKDGKFVEYGSRPNQGNRVDLDEVRRRMDDGEDPMDIDFTKWCMYRRAFDEYRSIKEVKRNWVTTVIWLYGTSGVGKTREAVDNGATMLEFDGKYISGYNGEDIVLFDDCDKNTFINRQYWLKLLDRYSMNIRIIGGFRNWKPKTIYITSNFSPNDLELDLAFIRRITEVKLLTH